MCIWEQFILPKGYWIFLYRKRAGKNERKDKEVEKTGLLCMGISVVLGAVAWIVQDMDPVIKEEMCLKDRKQRTVTKTRNCM